MYRSIYDLKDFYNSAPGQVVQGILRNHIVSCWADCRNDSVLGIGYAQPYLEDLLPHAARCYIVSPAGRGAYSWPEDRKNLTVLAEEAELPFETNSIDKILLIHSLEFAELPHANLQEIWRVLKSNGRLLVITPNRTGLWARAEWSPFGEGTPYSLNQLRAFLRDNLFTYERSKPVLFMPPLRMRAVLSAADSLETAMPYIAPALGGLHMVEARKQMYAGIGMPVNAHIRVRGRGNLIPDPCRARPSITHERRRFDLLDRKR